MTFRASLARRGVATSLHYPPVHRLAAYARNPLSLPRTETYADRSVTLPMFATMTDQQQDIVVAAVQSALGLAEGTA